MFRKLVNKIQEKNDRVDIRDISYMSTRTKKTLIDNFFKNTDNEIDIKNIKMGLFWRSNFLKYKFIGDEKDLELFKLHFGRAGDFKHAFFMSKNNALKIVDHPTFVIEIDRNGSLVIVYFTRTKGNSFKFTYFDVSNNRIYINERDENTINLLENRDNNDVITRVNIGGININTTGYDSLEEYLLKNNEYFTYYEFTSELNRESINEIESDSDREVLNNLLKDFNCENFEEFKLLLLEKLCEKAQISDIPINYNGVDVTINSEVFDNFSEENKERVIILRRKIVEWFIEVMEEK